MKDKVMNIKPLRGIKIHKSGFFQMMYSTVNDLNISPQSRLLITHCLSQSETWEFNIPQLSKVLWVGRDVIYDLINECIDHGYAYRHQCKGEKGRLGKCNTYISDSKEYIAMIKKELQELHGKPHQYKGSREIKEEDSQDDYEPNPEHVQEKAEDDCQPNTEHVPYSVCNDYRGKNISHNEFQPNPEHVPDLLYIDCKTENSPHNEFQPNPESLSEISLHNEREGNFGNPYNNMNTYKKTTTEEPGPVVVFSHKEVQKEEVPEVEKPKEPEAPKIWPVLETVNIPEHAKLWLTKTYPEEVVINAVAKALHPSTVINKNLESTIKWACKLRLKVEKTAKEIAEEEASDKQRQQAEMIAKHRAIALSYQGKDLGGVRLNIGHDMVDIRCLNQPPAFITYLQEGFLETMESKIKSFTANQGVASMQRSDNLCYCIEKPSNLSPTTSSSISIDNNEKQNKDDANKKIKHEYEIKKNKGEQRERLMEENRSYANPYHKQQYGNVVIYVFSTYIAFQDVKASDGDAPLDFLPLVRESFKADFKGCLKKHNFPLLELCEAGA